MGETVYNVFNIPDPESWWCQKVDFNYGLSLEARKEDAPVYYHIYFSSCKYVRLPMKWQSANFCMASSDECRAFLQHQNSTDNYDLYGHVFYVELKGIKFYVHAYRAEIKARDV